MQLSATLKDILQAAILAPSADNHHRLRFEPTAEGVLVWSEPGRLANLVGYKRTLDLLSLGAVIENIALRAGAHSLEASIELLPARNADLVADVRFRATASTPDPLHESIPHRHTNRRLIFKGPPANPTTLQQIGDAAQQRPGCTLDWLDSSDLRSKALRLIRLAEGERFHNQILHAELFENIRFESGWQQICEEALPPGALEIEAPLRPFFRLLRHWPVMHALNRVGAHKQLGWRAGDLPCRFAPHLGVISAPSLADQDQINTGRAFERAWLAVAQYGLALQPMPASVLYAQTTAVGLGIPGDIQKRLRAGWDELQPGITPLMVFRMGQANAPSLVSGRKPLESYLK
jgi:hypothetical protein